MLVALLRREDNNLLAVLLAGNGFGAVAVGAEPFGLLAPVLAVGEGPHGDVECLLGTLAAALDARVRALVAVGAVDGLGHRLELVERDGRVGVGDVGAGESVRPFEII